MSKKWIVLLVIVAGIVSGYWWFGHASPSEAQVEKAQLFPVKRADIEEVVTAQGKLEPKEFVDVGAQVAGQLKNVLVKIGDQVKKGEVLAEIESTMYSSRVAGDKARLKTLHAQVAAQQAQIVLGKQQYVRSQGLMKSNAVSQDALDTSKATLDIAQAGLVSLQAQIEEAESNLSGDEANLSYTKIYAPMSGTVVLQTAREGQTLNVNQSAPVIVQLANLDTMTVRAQVAEADVMKLKPGMDVRFSPLGALERHWQGRVRQILPTPEVINDVVLYNALVDVDNRDRELLMGMSTQMFFVIGKAANALVVPAAALGKRLVEQDNQDGRAYQIKLQQDNHAIEKTVYVGLANRSVVEVRAGLSEKDLVIGGAKAEGSKSSTQKPRYPMGPRL